MYLDYLLDNEAIEYSYPEYNETLYSKEYL
jgi:hypothetical protein